MSTFRRILSLSLLAGLCACGSIPTRQFEFRALDTADAPHPCMIVVNDDWETAAQKEQFVNLDGNRPLRLSIPFSSAEIEVTMAPVRVENGKVTRIPKSRKEARDYSNFMDDVRRLRFTDPTVHLFVLVRKTGGS